MRALTIIAAIAVTACGDLTGSSGEEGNLRYRIATDYELRGGLTDQRLGTGYTHRVDAPFTTQGSERQEDRQLSHVVTPSEGATVVNTAHSPEHPEFTLTVTEPGSYRIESRYGDTVFDAIELTFAVPVDYEVLMHTREPYDSEFGRVVGPGPVAIPEGSQVTFDVAPLDAAGERLLGSVVGEVTFSPQSAAVPAVGIIESYEYEVARNNWHNDYYFIDTGDVQATVRDPVHGFEAHVQFDVSDYAP